MECIIALDVGGTMIKGSKFIDGNLASFFEERTLIDNDNKASSLLFLIKKIIDDNILDDKLVGLGIAIPGIVQNGIIYGAENLGIDNLNFEKLLKEIYPDIPIVLCNDANSAVIGEKYYGSGVGYHNIVMVTLGTGIGGGIIIDDKLYTGSTGASGEFGHIRIFPFKGRPCSCGSYGCLEQYASATGIRRTAYGLRRGEKTTLNDHGRISVREIFDAAMNNDKIAVEVIDKTAYYLAIGLSIIANTINPDIIIIGGGVSKGGDTLLIPLRKYFKELTFSTAKSTKIELATLYNKAGCYGMYHEVELEVSRNVR